MFVANTSALIVFAAKGQVLLAIMSFFGATVTAYGVRNAVK